MKTINRIRSIESMRFLTAVAFVACGVLLVACSGSNTTESVLNPPKQESANLTLASVQPRDFLLAGSRLGRSAPEDIRLIGAMSGVAIEPKPTTQALFASPTSNSAVVVFKKSDRIINYALYQYAYHDSGEYLAIIRFGLDGKHTCLRVDDLTKTLGVPEGIGKSAYQDPITGPTDVGTVRYRLESGATAIFLFARQTCALQFLVQLNHRVEK